MNAGFYRISVKKVTIFILVLVIAFSLVGCSDNKTSTEMDTAKTFMKLMIDCDVSEAMNLFTGNAHDSWMFMSNYVIDFANGWMQGTQMSDWLYYYDKAENAMLIWYKDDKLPESPSGNWTGRSCECPVMYIHFAKVDKNGFTINQFEISTTSLAFNHAYDIWEAAYNSKGTRF